MRAVLEEVTSKEAAGIEEVFAVVEHQKRSLVTQARQKGSCQCGAWFLTNVEDASDGMGDEMGVCQRSQLHEPYTVRVAR
jgi:hypothetical protein